jgi:hypothetical protein
MPYFTNANRKPRLKHGKNSYNHKWWRGVGEQELQRFRKSCDRANHSCIAETAFDKAWFSFKTSRLFNDKFTIMVLLKTIFVSSNRGFKMLTFVYFLKNPVGCVLIV